MIILLYYYDIIMILLWYFMILPQFHDVVSYVFFLQWQRNVGMESGVWDYMKNVASGSNLVKEHLALFQVELYWNHAPKTCAWTARMPSSVLLVGSHTAFALEGLPGPNSLIYQIFSCRRYELPWTRQTELLCRKPITIKRGPVNDLQEILHDMNGFLIRGQHFVPPNSEQLRDPGRSWNIREQEIEQEIWARNWTYWWFWYILVMDMDMELQIN